MFTGIIEALGEIKRIEKEGTNVHFTLSSPFTHELQIDQSVAHEGVCLTVIKIEGNEYTVTAIDETMRKTNLSRWEVGKKVNLERCVQVGDRLDGHIVQGHVDMTATCTSVIEEAGSWRFFFEYSSNDHLLTVPKGSITINGVSLTVVDSTTHTFSIAIIPFTFEHTTFHALKAGAPVNLEFDVIGKYVQRYLNHFQQHSLSGGK